MTAPTTTAVKPTDFLSRATALVDRGFSTIPLQPRGKSPLGPGAHSRTRDLDQIKEWAAVYPVDANAAIVADDNITILESDDLAKFKSLLAKCGVTLPETLTGGASENRPHMYFKRTEACGDSCITVPGVFEFRNAGQYVVGSGSVHPSGAEYRFWNDTPIVEMPAELVEALRELDADYAGEIDPENPRAAHIQPGPYAALRAEYLRRLDPADMIAMDPVEVNEGERHFTLMSLAGLLHDGERSVDDIVDILREVQDHHFVGAKGDDELTKAAEYAVRGEPAQMEPRELESFSVGTVVFKTEFAMDTWLKENQDDFSVDWSLMRSEAVPEQEVLLSLNGVPMIRRETVSEIVAFRGIGKSMAAGGFIRALTTGEGFLGFQSKGGYRVLLVDGEMPKALLQSRLNNLVGPVPTGLLRVRSLSQTPMSYMAPMSTKTEQVAFMNRLRAWRPDVIIFDTKSSVFKHDTNDQQQLLVVNEFLIQLRAQGYAVILTHHAGKNGSQRGRTDNDDILDLVIQLKARDGWSPGDGLEFALEFEKNRYGDKLECFDAKWSREKGWERLVDRDSEVVGLALKGSSINAIAKRLKIGNGRVAGVLNRARKNGIQIPDAQGGRPAAGSEDAVAKASQLKAEGWTQQRIADEMKVSLATVKRWLKTELK
jgi:putative DNA primase/helicase